MINLGFRLTTIANDSALMAMAAKAQIAAARSGSNGIA
jgi:hypothetical protein